MKTTSMGSMEQVQSIVINGVKMTVKAYNKIKSQKNAGKKKAKKRQTTTDIKELVESIKKIIREAAPIKSLAAYYDNGYRQWGKIVEEFVFNNRYIKKPFASFRITARELYNIINELDKLSKKNDSCIFEYIDMLRYKMMDIDDEMIKLNKAITESGICEICQNEKFINEKGRRLGLRTLLINANISVYKLKESIEKIQQLSKTVEDNIEYDPYTLKRFN